MHFLIYNSIVAPLPPRKHKHFILVSRTSLLYLAPSLALFPMPSLYLIKLHPLTLFCISLLFPDHVTLFLSDDYNPEVLESIATEYQQAELPTFVRPFPKLFGV